MRYRPGGGSAGPLSAAADYHQVSASRRLGERPGRMATHHVGADLHFRIALLEASHDPQRRITEHSFRAAHSTACSDWGDPDHNPLRRRLDRIEAAVVGGLVVAFLAGAPLASLTVHPVVWHAASGAARAEQTWRQVPAVLLASAPESVDASAPATWTAPDGTRRRGVVAVAPGTRAGTRVSVWVDATGRLTGRPPRPLSQVPVQAALGAMLAPTIQGAVLLCAGLLVHHALGRRRLAAWDADWRATGPQWTRQHLREDHGAPRLAARSPPVRLRGEGPGLDHLRPCRERHWADAMEERAATSLRPRGAE
jgi:hypothetical protein